MTKPTLERVFALFDAAIALPDDEARDRLLRHGTASDEVLRAQVRAMLSADAASHPILDHGYRLPAAVGRVIGGYRVVRELGRGGMATVYLVHDARHDRQLALKLLHTRASSPAARERFRREIALVARLQHPHILPLYDSGEDSGRPYYVMPIARDGSLRDRLARAGPLPLEELRRVLAAIASATDAAHHQGIVHRDITPANILLSGDQACLADFGVARLALEAEPGPLTGAGLVVGTPAFMSPEQAAGEQALSPRSDLYALGCVVFAMLTGTPPYHGSTASEILRQHVQAPIPSVRSARPDLPVAVEAVMRRALAKAPAERFRSAREFAEALTAALVGSARMPRWLAPAAGLAVVILALAVAGSRLRDVPPPSIAVLPFATLDGDAADAYLGDGVTEELIGALAQVGGLRVTPRTTAFGFRNRTGDIATIGTALDVTHLVEGSVRRDGDRVHVLATLYEAGSGARLWTERYEREWGNMVVLQAEIASTIATRLRGDLLPEQRSRLGARHTANAEAYDHYLRGRHFFDVRTASGLAQAVGHFRRALELDTAYARAFAGLADSYSILAWTGSGDPRLLFDSAEVAAQRAVRLDPQLAEAHVSLGIIRTFHHWDWAAADQATARAIALDSTLATAWFFRAWHLAAAGQDNAASHAIERARQLEPLSLIINARLATQLAWQRRYQSADSVLRRTLEIDPTYPVARVQLARVLSMQGRHGEAIAALPPDTVQLGSFESGIAGFVHARAGNTGRARELARELERRAHPPGEGIAAVYAALGDATAAMTWLERAVDARGPGLIFLHTEPMYESLRGDPRFQGVVARVKRESR